MNGAESQQPTSRKSLEANQRRVFGVLIEKAKTTPAGYPMTVNAIVTGCNQKSNRQPQMSLDDFDVQNALNELQTLGAVSEVDWMGRAPKYRHQGYDWLGVSKAELAVLAELLLRGEQTLGDLRSRAARMEPIADQAALRPIVDGLVQRGLMIELTPPGRGQIVTHNLYLEPELAELRRRGGRHVEHPRESGGFAPAAAREVREAATADRALASEIAALREEVASLREEVRTLTRRLEAQG